MNPVLEDKQASFRTGELDDGVHDQVEEIAEIQGGAQTGADRIESGEAILLRVGSGLNGHVTIDCFGPGTQLDEDSGRVNEQTLSILLRYAGITRAVLWQLYHASLLL